MKSLKEPPKLISLTSLQFTKQKSITFLWTNNEQSQTEF